MNLDTFNLLISTVNRQIKFGWGGGAIALIRLDDNFNKKCFLNGILLNTGKLISPDINTVDKEFLRGCNTNNYLSSPCKITGTGLSLILKSFTLNKMI